MIITGLYSTVSSSLADTWGELFTATLNSTTPKQLLTNGDQYTFSGTIVSANTNDANRRLRFTIGGTAEPDFEFPILGDAQLHICTGSIVRLSDISIMVSVTLSYGSGSMPAISKYEVVTVSSLTSNSFVFDVDGKCGATNADSLSMTSFNIDYQYKP